MSSKNSPSGLVLNQANFGANGASVRQLARELPSVDPVFIKELAAHSGISEKTIRERMHLWETQPEHPLAIPYLRHLGRPFRVSREFARQFCGTEAVA